MKKKLPETLDEDQLKIIRETRSGHRALWLIVGLTLAVIGVVVYMVFLQSPSRPDRFLEKTRITDPGRLPAGEAGRSEPPPATEEDSAARSLNPPPPAGLMESDAYLKEQLASNLEDPLIQSFFKQQGVIRKVVAVIHNIARGESPKPHLDFISFPGPFAVIAEGDDLRISERSFSRYNGLVDAFVDLDTRKIANLYRTTESLFDQAYRELGYTGKNFRPVLHQAFEKILKVPVIFDRIYVDPGVLSYEYVREDLRSLSKAQKHFLRLGPLNLRRVQKKIRELQELLGD